MRVLFVTQVVDKSDDNLGAIHGWIAALASQVDTLHVLTLRTGAMDLPPNVFVHSVGKDLGNGKLRQLEIFNSVVTKLALQRQVDVFFPHAVPRYAILLAPYRLTFRIPTVMWYAHNSADLRLKAANLCVDRFVSPSDDSLPLQSSKLRVVGQGVDTDLFRPLDGGRSGQTKDRVRFLSLGRISPRKELDTLVSAVELLVNRWGRSEVEVVVAGAPLAPSDHEYQDRLKARVRELKLEDHVLFTGGIPHSETVSQLQKSDFFVNMHVGGGLGKAVLEAMSCGKPTFVSTPTYYDGYPEHTEAFLFTPRDPEDLARKMRGALDIAPVDAWRMGEELREMVIQKHDVRRQMSRIVDVFHEVRGKGRL